MLSEKDIEAVARELVKAEGRDPDEKFYPSMHSDDPPVIAWEAAAGFVRKIAFVIDAIERRKEH